MQLLTRTPTSSATPSAAWFFGRSSRPAANRGADADAEQVRHVARARFAATLDHDLRQICRAEASARLALGAVAGEVLRRHTYRRLGFVRLSDYARERLGTSARGLESAAFVATHLDELPDVAAAFRRGDLSWTQVRLLASVARREDEDAWLARARGGTVEALEAAIRACREANGGAATPDSEDDLLDGEPAVVLRIACPGRVCVLWRSALELARRVAGAEVAPWGAAELIAAEGIAGRPAGARVGDRVLVALVHLKRRLSRSMRGGDVGTEGAPAASVDSATSESNAVGPDSDASGTTIAAARAALGHSIGDVAVPLADAVPLACDDLHRGDAGSTLANCDAFALDTRLCDAMQAIRSVEPRIGRLLRVVIDQRLYRAFGCLSADSYVRERLGISPRKAWALVKVERHLRRAAPLADAYERGALSWVRALTLLPVVDRRTARDWLARANAVTVRRLTDEVNWVLDARDVLGIDAPSGPPPPDSVLSGLLEERAVGPAVARRCQETSPGAPVQIGAPPSLPREWPRNGTAPSSAVEVADGEIRLVGPATVVALFRDAVDAFARDGEPRWVAVERLLRHVIGDWEAAPGHRDPVFARDGWRCTVPACSGRRNLHDHHLCFRSRGGGNGRANRATVCAAHHLHGIHTGVIRAWGTAPAAVRWELGVRPDAPPFLAYVGDRLCATS